MSAENPTSGELLVASFVLSQGLVSDAAALANAIDAAIAAERERCARVVDALAASYRKQADQQHAIVAADNLRQQAWAIEDAAGHIRASANENTPDMTPGV